MRVPGPARPKTGARPCAQSVTCAGPPWCPRSWGRAGPKERKNPRRVKGGRGAQPPAPSPGSSQARPARCAGGWFAGAVRQGSGYQARACAHVRPSHFSAANQRSQSHWRQRGHPPKSPHRPWALARLSGRSRRVPSGVACCFRIGGTRCPCTPPAQRTAARAASAWW